MKIQFVTTKETEKVTHECISEYKNGEIIFTCKQCNYRRGFNISTGWAWVENPNDKIRHI